VAAFMIFTAACAGKLRAPFTLEKRIHGPEGLQPTLGRWWILFWDGVNEKQSCVECSGLCKRNVLTRVLDHSSAEGRETGDGIF
jgi:hypothetical protein